MNKGAILIGILSAIPIVSAQDTATGFGAIDTLLVIIFMVFVFLGIKKLLEAIK